jgi:hypothetical protein
MSNLSLSSVGIWCIILAQNKIIKFVDFISNTRTARANDRCPGLIAYQQYRYHQFYGPVSSNHLMTAASACQEASTFATRKL